MEVKIDVWTEIYGDKMELRITEGQPDGILALCLPGGSGWYVDARELDAALSPFLIQLSRRIEALHSFRTRRGA